MVNFTCKQLSMQIFYGSLCGDSINFIQNQVHPIHNDIKDYVNITFVPFGIGKSVIQVKIPMICTYVHFITMYCIIPDN